MLLYNLYFSFSYAPQKIDIDYKLKPFLPDYIPAVGDIDAFIKVETPEFNLKGEKLTKKTLEKIEELGKSEIMFILFTQS